MMVLHALLDTTLNTILDKTSQHVYISYVYSISFIVIPQSLDRAHVPNDIHVLDFLTGSVSVVIM